MNPEWVAKKIKELGLKPSRGNGQNFLINDEPINKIISAGAVTAGETVLEIGSGLGILTSALIKIGARVKAVEFDQRLAAYLIKKFPYPHEIIQGDILQMAKPEFLRALQPYKIIANIPYHITGEIIKKFIETPYPPTTLCLLMQKEVGERLIATPPRTNQLALFTQWFASVEYIATVPRTYFMPVPDVDSCIMRITPSAGEARNHGLTPQEQKKLFSVIKRGFSHPRKQLCNNLGPLPDHATISATRRAETLTHAEWITLVKILANAA